MDEIEQLLEGGKAEAAAQRAVHSEAPSNGHTHDSDNEVRLLKPACLNLLHWF